MESITKPVLFLREGMWTNRYKRGRECTKNYEDRVLKKRSKDRFKRESKVKGKENDKLSRGYNKRL